MPQWVLKVKDVITCICNNMLGYCCLIECCNICVLYIDIVMIV